MSHKIGVSVNEMLEMRKQGLSNADIANLLEISRATVYRYIGGQGCKMESMAAFEEKPKAEKPKAVEAPVETPEIKRAVDEIVVRSESVSSKSGKLKADIDYNNCSVIICDDILFTFDELPELATFVIGMTERIMARMPKKEVREC